MDPRSVWCGAGNWALASSLGYGRAMNRTLLTLATASIFALGCGSAALEQAAPTAPIAPAVVMEKAAATPAVAGATKADETQKPAVAPAITGALASRKVGDFVVYRFTGSFRKATLTLTEKVVAKKGTILTIDLTADEAGKREELRVKIDEATGAHGEVLSVSKLEGGIEKPESMAAYEALMARTALAADENEAALGTDDITVDVGGAQLACKRSSFRVRVGNNHGATLKTIESDAFAWGDVGGEITAQNGKTLYRAEVIEVGHADGKPAVAISDIDDE